MFLETQIQVLLDDITPSAIKIGALGGAEQVEAVVRALSRYPGPIVWTQSPSRPLVRPCLTKRG